MGESFSDELLKNIKGKPKKGFTVLELLIVIVILSILYSIAAFYTAGLQDEARISRTKGDLKTLHLSLMGYMKDNGFCPQETDYQTMLLLNNSNILDKNLMDPFGATNNCLYPYSASDNRKYYVVFSVGPKKNGNVEVGDAGTLVVDGLAIYETNGFIGN